MKRSHARLLLAVTANMLLLGSQAQNQWKTLPTGETYLDPTSPNPLPTQVTVGIAPNTNSTFSNFNVFADPQGSLLKFDMAEFHSKVNDRGFVRWYRGNGNTDQMGRIYHNDSDPLFPNLGFNIQECQQGGSLWGRNTANTTGIAFSTYGNGWRLIDDIPFNVGIYNNLLRDGNIAIGDAANMDAATDVQPWTRLHLVHSQGNLLTDAFRPWDKNGVGYSGNDTWMYVGQKYHLDGDDAEERDSSDAVIHWGDKGIAHGATNFDNCRFLFTLRPDGSSTSGSASKEGLEIMRLRPFLNDHDRVEGFVGVGDWFGANARPEERLDVLDRTIRARELPTLPYYCPTCDTAVVVNGTGRLNWRLISGMSGADCDWKVNTPSPALNNVSTAFGPAVDNCPDKTEAVGIGVDLGGALSPAKLRVVTDNYATAEKIDASMSSTDTKGLLVTTSGGTATNYGIDVQNTSGSGNRNYGINVNVAGTTTRSRGIVAEVNGATGYNSVEYGGQFDALGSGSPWYSVGAACTAAGGTSQNFGVYASTSGSATTNNLGVFGYAGTELNPVFSPAFRTGVSGRAHSNTAADICIGVYGIAIGPDVYDPLQPPNLQHTKWAGYFPGYTYTPGGTWSASDEQLKLNIQELAPDVAVTKLLALQPKTYDFNQDQFGFMHLPSEHQFGMIAQNVADVLPELVTNIHQPAELDSTGGVVHPEVDFKAMSYQGFIPLLIAGFQRQQATIASLQTQINNCCTLGGMTQGGNHAPVSTGTNSIQEERLTIVPNPFSDHTTLHYYVPQQGKVSLQVSGSDGRPIGTLREEQADAGEYTYEWNTQSLAAGMYYVSVVVDGKVVVMKGVKVEER